jgi:hypothetical protein
MQKIIRNGVIFRKPWRELTRSGIPAFVVARRPMVTEGVLTEVGEPVPPQICVKRVRLRQLYEMRMIDPAGGQAPAPALALATATVVARPSVPMSPAAPAIGNDNSYVPPKRRTVRSRMKQGD